MTQRFIAVLCWLPIFSAGLLFVYSLFFLQAENDWDIDAFLYLGSRLLHGELLYVQDFEMKLPLVQYIFAIPSLLGGIGAWRIFTLFVVLSLSVPASYLLAVDLLRKSRSFFFGVRNLTVLISGLYLLLLYSLPGSESAHIEMIAASAAYLSIVMVIIIDQGETHLGTAILAGIFIGVAALIRPNYLYVFAFCTLWILLANTTLYPIANQGVKVLLFISGFLGAIALSFVPYFFTENGIVLLKQGISALVVSKHGISALTPDKDVETQQLVSWQMSYETRGFYLPLYGSIAILLLLFFVSLVDNNKKVLVNYGIPASISILMVTLSLIQTHYYVHNTIMYVPYMVLITVTLANFLNRPRTQSIMARTTVQLLIIGLIAFVFASPVSILVSSLTKVVLGRVDFDPRINRRGIDHKLLSFLKTCKERSNTFLVADNTIYHRLLDETRIGDGHPAILGAVLSGRRIGPVGNIYLYSEEAHKKPCSVLFNSGKDIIITEKKGSASNTLVNDCFSEEQTVYSKIEVPGLGRYNVFKRNSG